MLSLKVFKVREAGRVNEVQAIKVAAESGLLRGGSQQQKASASLSQIVNKLTYFSARLADTRDVVSLIDHHHVPIEMAHDLPE